MTGPTIPSAGDLDLTEKAARAAGFEVRRYRARDLVVIHVREQGGQWRQYGPLTDDGDALRLAVRLGLCIFFVDGQMAVGRWYSGAQGLDGASEKVAGKGDAGRAEAVRRAIVRAAAEIAEVVA